MGTLKSELLIKAAKIILKELLEQCTFNEQKMFKRMYSHKDLNLSIDEVVENIALDKIDWAICQCENTLKKKL